MKRKSSQASKQATVIELIIALLSCLLCLLCLLCLDWLGLALRCLPLLCFALPCNANSEEKVKPSKQASHGHLIDHCHGHSLTLRALRALLALLVLLAFGTHKKRQNA